MSTLGELLVRVNADTSGLNRGLAETNTRIGAMQRGLTGLSGALAGFLSFRAIEGALAGVARAADEQEASGRRLVATSRLLHQNLEALATQSERTADKFDLSVRVSQDFTASMARLTTQAGQTNRLGEATAAWLELAAANGVSAEESMDALRLTILGQDEGLNKLGLANPSGLYKQWADAAGVTAGKMSDMQKSQAILDAVIHAGDSVRGSYSQWLESAAGQQSVLRARVEDSSAAIGRSFNGIRVAVIPTLVAIVQKVAAFAGGIQILGADLVVGVAQVQVWSAYVRSGVATVLASVSGMFTRLAQLKDALPAPLQRILGFDPSKSAVAGLGPFLQGNLGGAGLAAAQEQLRRARSARDDVVANILRDSAGFGRLTGGGTGGGLAAVPNAVTDAAKRASDAVDELARKFRDLAKEQVAAADAFKRTNVLGRGMLGATTTTLPSVEIGPLGRLSQRTMEGPKAAGEAAKASDTLKVAGDKIGGFTDKFTHSVGGMLAQFGPMALALAAVNAVLEPLQPLIDALLVPFSIVGEMLAIAFVPVLKILWPIIKAVAIVFSYLQEATDRIIGGILWAAGGFVKGMGKLINAITPFANPGNPLIKAGQAIQDAGKGFTDAAKEIAKRRKELEGLSFEDALDKTKDAADRLTESMLNAVQGFKIASFRFAAMEGRTAGAVPQASSSASLSAAVGDNVVQIGEVHLHAAPGEDVEEIWRKLKALIQRESRSKTALRSLAAQIA